MGKNRTFTLCYKFFKGLKCLLDLKKRERYSLKEVEDMLMNDPDSGDSDIDLGEDLADWGDEGYWDEGSENEDNNEEEAGNEESDNEISFRSTATEQNELTEATPLTDDG